MRIDTQFVIVPILRAGLGMTPAVQEVLPRHRVCLVGLRRNETTLRADVYLDGLPEDLERAPVVLCDPMLATGGSLIQVLDMLRQRNAGEITALCLIAAQPGLDAVRAAHPDVRIVAAALDQELTDDRLHHARSGRRGRPTLRSARSLIRGRCPRARVRGARG